MQLDTTPQDKSTTQQEETETDIVTDATADNKITYDTQGQDNNLNDEEAIAPTISLEILEGPIYSSSDDVCYYRIKATVTGSPSPKIKWSTDYSNGTLGKDIAQVNLTRDNPTYTLTATATNSEGSATDEIDLSWSCDGEVNNTFDTLGRFMVPYNWSKEPYGPMCGNILGESGTVTLGIYDSIRMGDSQSNKQFKGYITWDISELNSKTVQYAEINFDTIEFLNFEMHSENDPCFADYLDVKFFLYGTLDAADFAIGGVMLARIPTSLTSYSISGDVLKSELQKVLDDPEKDYFQLKLGLSEATDNDSIPEYITIGKAELNIQYLD